MDQFPRIVVDAHPYKLRFIGSYFTDEEIPVGMNGNGDIQTKTSKMLLTVLEEGEIEDVVLGLTGTIPAGFYAITDDGFFRISSAA